MAAADIIYGLAVTSTAIYRSYLIVNGEQNDPISAWDCTVRPPAFLNGIGLQLTSVMNVVVSVDRLIAVALPIKYRQLDQRYAVKVLMLVAIFGATSLTAMFLSTYYTSASHELTATKYCSGFPTQYWYDLYQTMLIITGCGYVSVAIYVCVFFVYRRTTRQTAPLSTSSHNQQMIEQQQRLTVTLGIITLSTLILFNIPFTIFAVCKLLGVSAPQPTLLGIISRFSTIINVVLYVYRQKEMKKAIWALVRCKKVASSSLNAHTPERRANFTFDQSNALH
uniref:G-protein coupled receptors family 1 profile domain-containing protein n=1 Tax=Plectus sambesii TaxID=2011161 RepID=A0A914VFS1_9BILA